MNDQKPVHSGWIEVITGGMFSGKTEELIRRMKHARYARKKTLLFRPSKDIRYSTDSVGSHSGQKMPSLLIAESTGIMPLVPPGIQVVGIDEAQFLDHGLVSVCEFLADKGVRVIVAGLDQDYLGKPFGPIPHLLAVSEYVTKMHAVCVVCGDPASRSQRTVQVDTQVLVGEKEAYEPRCRACFSVTNFTPTPPLHPPAEG